MTGDNLAVVNLWPILIIWSIEKWVVDALSVGQLQCR